MEAHGGRGGITPTLLLYNIYCNYNSTLAFPISNYILLILFSHLQVDVLGGYQQTRLPPSIAEFIYLGLWFIKLRCQ
jgi:hypothetical protein